MFNKGYIKLNREILSWGWYKNINTLHVYLHLLLKANFKDGEFESRKIKTGQVVTSLRHLSDETGLSLQQVRTALKHLKSTHDVTIETTSNYTIITMKNYEKHTLSTHNLTSEQQTSNKRATYEQQQYNKNNKKYKNNKGINNYTNSSGIDYAALFDS